MSGDRQEVEGGTLYVVATPLGNLKDITLRALDILASVDIIASEDTRTCLKLLNHYGLKGPKLVAYHEHNERKKTPPLIKALKTGKSVALVSEAGTPGISDPGALLVAKAHEEGLRVVPVPGPSALSAALSCAGLRLEEGFLFLGFLPSKRGPRRRLLEEVREERRPLVFYETPHRLSESLEDLWELLGERRIFMAREMTKIHEECRWWLLSELLKRSREERIRGEITLILEGKSKKKKDPEELEGELERLLQEGISLKEASQILGQKYGLSTKALYQLGLKKKGKNRRP